ncbi:EamA family transporter [Pseudarthrobacter sp. P1]|uniref:EamA family transporter n=1 Tax=Pseudarthrobacter sp. P1 TaxID=3418418 RepID=UPI003CF2F5C3
MINETQHHSRFPPGHRRRRLPGLALVWGAGFLFMKVSLEALSPFEAVLGRLVLGAVTLLATSLMIPAARLTRTKSASIVLGAVGVVVIIGPWRFGGEEFTGLSFPA